MMCHMKVDKKLKGLRWQKASLWSCWIGKSYFFYTSRNIHRCAKFFWFFEEIYSKTYQIPGRTRTCFHSELWLIHVQVRVWHVWWLSFQSSKQHTKNRKNKSPSSPCCINMKKDCLLNGFGSIVTHRTNSLSRILIQNWNLCWAIWEHFVLRLHISEIIRRHFIPRVKEGRWQGAHRKPVWSSRWRERASKSFRSLFHSSSSSFWTLTNIKIPSWIFKNSSLPLSLLPSDM